MKNIDLIREVTQAAAGQWPYVLAGLNISIPDSPRKHAPCPVCGGKDRFRFDDGGRGSFICNQCGAGDGLDLIQKVHNCNATEAAVMVADVLSIDYRAAEHDDTASQRNDQREAERRKREQEHQQQAAAEAEKRRAAFSAKYQALVAKSTPGQSAYLTAKGLEYPLPLLPDGSLLVALTNGDGAVTGAQTIKPDGEKRLVAGTVKKGAFFTVNTSDNPQTVIIGEGLATVLSVHLMRPDAMAVTAIDAGNLLPVAKVIRRMYPDAQIIIAADNDIKPGEPNTGRDAAEKAAKSISGWLTLPPGEHKADWNDYHQANGLDAATAAFNDSMYQPEGEKLAVKLKAIEGGKKRRSRETHIHGDELKPRVEVRRDGIYWIKPKLEKDTLIETVCQLSTPFEVIAEGEDAESKITYTVMKWLFHGKERIRSIEGGAIGDPDGWRIMKNGGVKITSNHYLRGVLSDWIQEQSAKAPYRAMTPRAGWFEGAYLMPNGDVIGVSETPVMFCGGSAASDAYCVKGTAESWRDNVAVLAKGNPFQMLAAATALSAPMVGIVGADGFGIHLYADSTAGKTTAEDFGSSLYGLPERQRLTWYGTALGIANEAEAHNDGLLCLDEIGQGTKPHDVYTSAYTLFNGKGKLQGDKSGGNRVIRYWKTVVISTGETSVESYLMTTNIRIKAGQLVRLLNIPVTHPEELHGYQNAKEHADALKDAWTENHGAAGREWIKYLAAHHDEARQAYKAAKERWVSLIPASYGEQVFRVSDRFAVLEAALITGSFITGWSEQDCRDALQHAFNVWVAEFGTGNKEREQIIDQATAFLVANSVSRFIPVGFDELSQLNVHNIAGYTDKGDYEAGGKVKFYVLPATFKYEIAKHFDANKVASVLHDAGMLKRPASGKGWQVKTPRIKHLNNRQLRAYAVVLIDEEEVG